MRHMNISVPLASGGTEVTYGIKRLTAAVGSGPPPGTHASHQSHTPSDTGLWHREQVADRAEHISRGIANTRLSTSNRPSTQVDPRVLTRS